MVGQTAGILAVLSLKDEIKSLVAYDNQDFYRSLGLRVYDTIKDERFYIDVLNCRSLISVHGREIVPVDLLRCGDCVNVHPYFNFYKGARPIRKAIEQGNVNADVTMHEMTEVLDEGKIIKQEFKTVKLTNEADVYNQLYPLYLKVLCR